MEVIIFWISKISQTLISAHFSDLGMGIQNIHLDFLNQSSSLESGNSDNNLSYKIKAFLEAKEMGLIIIYLYALGFSASPE